MNINPTTSNSFKGYDARPLKGFFMRSNFRGIANEMKAIGDKEGFKIFAPQHKLFKYQYVSKESLPAYKTNTVNLWAQDKWMVVKNELLAYDLNNVTDSIKKFFRIRFNPVQQKLRDKVATPFYNADTLSYMARAEADARIDDYLDYQKEMGELRSSCHIAGGNAFIVKDGKKDALIVGEDELKNFSLKEIKDMFSVNKLTVLPQMDFHLDLFIRPLDNKRILLADDNKSLEVLKSGIDKILEYVNGEPNADTELCFDIINKILMRKVNLETELADNMLPKADEVEAILQKNGYEVIRVPGRVYRIAEGEEKDLQHYCNYMNANVLKNKDGELVYITNKGLVDDMLGLTPELSKKFGFSFEKAFVDSISPYVKKEHIYFVSGERNSVATEMLFLNQGGIHCACMEIPE